jgi:hypothetical protein
MAGETLETLEPLRSFSRPRPLHALKLGGVLIRIGVFGRAPPQRPNRLLA